jgi:hypothetical protein
MGSTRPSHHVEVTTLREGIIIIIGDAALFEPWPSLEYSTNFHPVFTSLEFASDFFSEQGRQPCVQLPEPGGPGLYIYAPPVTAWPIYTPRHRVPFWSPSATREATVEVLDPASTRGTS